jgi:type II secretory pathway component PulF
MKRRHEFDDLLLFTQHVGSAMQLGVPLHQTVALLSGEMVNRSLRKALSAVAKDLAAGSSLHEALSKFPAVFPEYYLRVLRVGEESGTLPETMEHLVSLLEKNFTMSQNLRRAFAYPIVILTLLAAAATMYTGWILPQFADVYNELGAELPAATLFLMRFCNWMFPAAFLAALFLFLLARRFARSGWCGLMFDRFDLNFPFLGVFTRYAIASRLTRTLGVMLRSGVTLPDAMGLCANMLDNQAARKSINAARESVERGETLGTSLLSESLFPPTMVWMLSAAEVRGDFIGALDHLADFYAVKVENTIAWFLEILEPLLIIIVGGVMVILAFGLFQPVLSLVNVIE